MKYPIRQFIPVTFLITASVWWGIYYSSNSTLNRYGSANFEWLYLIDTLFVLPVICYLCSSDKTKACLQAGVLSCTAVFIGSYIIPEKSKVIQPYLEDGRYLVLGVILLFEIYAIYSVCRVIRKQLSTEDDPDYVIKTALTNKFGTSLLSAVLIFEARVWTFLLFSSQIKSANYAGHQHFYYHTKDGAQSNLLGFIIVNLIELPLAHLLLHFVWSPTAAYIVTVLTALSIVFFIAEYKAICRRPVSLSDDALIIRYGLSKPRVIPLTTIRRVAMNSDEIRRRKSIKRMNYFGQPNVVIELKQPVEGIERIFLGVDAPDVFVNAIHKATGLLQTNRYKKA